MSSRFPETLPLPEGYDLYRRYEVYGFTLRQHGAVVYTSHALRGPALEEEDSPELRAFAAAMMTAAVGGWTRVDAAMQALVAPFEVFGRHEVASPRTDLGAPWYAHVVWATWGTEPPHLVYAHNGASLPGEPSHYRLLAPPREVQAAMAAEAGAA